MLPVNRIDLHCTARMEGAQASEESRVLVIYTGGTIGMLVGSRGLVTEPYFLTQTLRSQNRFHDPLQDSLYSHSDSIEGFRQWTSGRGSPIDKSLHQSVMLPVRSCRPIGLSNTLGISTDPAITVESEPSSSSTQISEGVHEALLPTLVTPRLAGPSGKRIRYAVLEVSFYHSPHSLHSFVSTVLTDFGSGIPFLIVPTSRQKVGLDMVRLLATALK